jgi:hypothetical protein
VEGFAGAVERLLCPAGSVCASIDGWTAQAGYHFFGSTISWLDAQEFRVRTMFVRLAGSVDADGQTTRAVF